MIALMGEKVEGGWNILCQFPQARDEENKVIKKVIFFPAVQPKKNKWGEAEIPLDFTIKQFGSVTIQPETRSMPKMDALYAQNTRHEWRRTGEEYTKVGQQHAVNDKGKPVFMRLMRAKGHNIPEQIYPMNYIWVAGKNQYIPEILYKLDPSTALVEKSAA